ncbi:MAG: DNA replication/repair protein RecF [Bacteroidia bacterium]|nr:DNA replication/repair protein RecF [Bacteroidia bacterium]
MYIQSLYLNNFRNYEELKLDFSSGINCFCGPNGAGKTNILDAIHYLALTRGFRNNQDRQAVKKGEQYFLDQGEIQQGEHSWQVQCNFAQGKGKRLIVNKKTLRKLSEHIGRIPLVAILPHDTELINGPSAGRRRFLDVLISQYDSAYLRHLIQYDKILAQRNALLKQFAEDRRWDEEQMELWDAQLIPHGIGIHGGRSQFIEDFQPIFAEYFKEIVAEDEVPRLTYYSQLEENTEAGWIDLLKNNRMKDQVNQYTGVGAHRDDLRFYIDEQSVRNFGSQGQQKTFIISLKLAQYQLLEAHKEISPVLLLDDIFDKLDDQRLGRIAAILDQKLKGQTFITDTSYERLAKVFDTKSSGELRFFSVNSGEVEYLDQAETS